jgi:thiamine transport system permease protein
VGRWASEKSAAKEVPRRGSHIFPLARLLIYSIPIIFLLLFYFYPLISILSLSFAFEGRFDPAAIETLLNKPHYLRTLWFTIWQALVSTLLTVGLALPGAYVFARYEFPGKSLVQALTTVPFVLPTIVVAMAFGALLGPRGLVNTTLMEVLGLDRPPLDLQHRLAIILLAHVFYNYTLVVRIVSTYWANLDPRLAEAARMLGASRWRAFREVTLPLLIPAVGAAALLVFIFCFTSFGVILVLGGPRFATLEVEIYRQTVNYFNLPLAATLSIFQIVFTFTLMAVYTRIQARTALPLELRSRRATQRRPLNWRERLLIGANVGLMLALLATPLGALVARSFSTESGLTLDFYRFLFYNPRESAFYVPPGAAALNSLGFALATVALSVTLGLMAVSALAQRKETRFSPKIGFLRRVAKTRFLDPIFMLPLGTSAVTLGLGYIVALDEPPLNLRASPVLIVLAHTLVALPFVVRSVLPALQSINPRLRESAALLGASPWHVWREVDLPIVARAVLVSAVFAFTISMGEFGATSLIARPERPTLPVAIYRYLGRPGVLNYGQAMAMATILMLVCAAGFLAIERFRVGEVGEF